MSNEQVRVLLAKDLQKNYDTQKEMAQTIGIAPAHLNDLLRGKREPAGKVLDYLHLRRVVTYEKVEPQAA